MSQANQMSDTSNLISIDSSEAQEMLQSIRALRRRIVETCQARAVLLTKEEQRELWAEIRDTCTLLTDLTLSEVSTAQNTDVPGP